MKWLAPSLQSLVLPLFFIGGLCGLSFGSSTAIAASQAEAPAWVIDPAVPGENLPASGRSQFDRLFATVHKGKVDYELPFPFAALLARIDAQLGRDPASSLPPAKRVLIPLGRSLQRTAAAPDYFTFPRVVVVADSPPATPSAPFLKDRLYIGYQEKSDVLEVISYNEEAGRFEFQLVKNYRAGATPQVVYANRSLCFACHQNGAPIFSRALWDETNANPQVAALLLATGKRFHGISPERGVDVPYAIDIAIRRANGFALTQRLWREGCGDADPVAIRCRAGLFTAALRHSLSNGRVRESDSSFKREVDAPLRAEAARRWPGGLAIGAPDIPNRNPLQGLAIWPDEPARRVAHSHVSARFEPLAPRPAREIWRADAGDAVDQLVSGLAEFVATTDRQRLEATLSTQPARLVRQRAPCRFEPGASRWSVRCQAASGESVLQLVASLEMRGGRSPGRSQVQTQGQAPQRVLGAQLERLTLPGSSTFNALELTGSTPGPGDFTALVPASRPLPRGADGNPLTRIVFRVLPGEVREVVKVEEGSVLVELRQEFTAVEQAVAALATGPDGPALFGPRPFPREQLFAALFAQLGAPAVAPCCQAADRLPTPRLEVPAALPGHPATAPMDPTVQGFYPYCATCHQSAETFPPNFLSGSSAQVKARLRQCAPRLYVRLAMADLTLEQRDKTPMPPESLLPAFATDIAGWRASPVRAALLAQVGDWLRSESGHPPNLKQLLADGYESLRPCQPQP
ncbi:MAG: hypothetical protein JNM42_00625 [Propionivibrio sp.]|uniref:hypothetical protein n=1 Tax=Propionivibrio sp. TaxID=2212460 RepID=UPI001A4F6E74|nr:hypothetical protein [Propionivibrio sp.]MBL8412925.1 hypothetical protein [Propionivibrio sp.]